MPAKKKAVDAVADALRWVDSIRRAEGFSLQEMKLIALADEVKKLRRDLQRTQIKTRGALRPVPTPMDVDAAAEAAMAYIDELGAPPLPRPAWIAMLEEIIGQCRTRIELAHEDDKRDK